MTDRIFAKKYVIQEEIARGGMGVIYKALDRTLHRIVAIKQIHAHLSGDPSFAERFLREARAMARIQHDNIVTIFGVEEDEGTQFLVMEFFGPTNLRTLIRQPHRIPLRDVVRIAEQLASALAYAHAQGIIHRDIKPANVLIDKKGKAKLTDFGIAAALDEASITSTGQVIGTPEYMSPEQARGVKIDGRSDLYSLGIMIYEMVNGKPPYPDTSKTAILGKLVFEQQELSLQFPAGVPVMLQGVIRDLIRRNPDERIPDADALASQLHEILYTLPQSQSPSAVESEPTVVPSSKIPSPAQRTSVATLRSPEIPEPPTRLIKEESTRLVESPPSREPEIVERKPSPILDETSLLPSQSPPPQKARSPEQKPAPPPTPTPTMPPFLWIGSGAIALLTATVGLVWYLASQPDISRQDPKPDTPPVHSPNGQKQPPITVAKNDELAQQQRQLEDETKRVEEKKRLADEQLAKEEAERKEEERRRQIAAQRAAKEQEVASQRARQAQRAKEEAERLEQQRQRDLEAKKLREQEQRLKAGDEDKAAFVAQQSKDDAERREQERQRELALQRAREEEQKRKAAAEEEKARQNTRQQEHERVARAFPDTQLTSLLNKFQRAYERCDFGTLQSLSQMSDRRKDNVEFMFSNYTGFTASIQNVTETQDGASATLLLHTGTRVTGETIPIRELSGTFKIKVTRRGQEWDKIVW